MESIQVTPHRSYPGVGVGSENKDSIYNVTYEKSPYHRVPLGDQNRVALLSGAQRVVIKPSKGHTENSAHNSHRSPNNFMKATESSRLSTSTPVRQNASHVPSPGTTAPRYIPVTPAAESASIHQFVSPLQYNVQSSNPLMTPTRAQSAGRMGSARVQSATPPAPVHHHQVTPGSEEVVRPVPFAASTGRRSALASPPGRLLTSPARGVRGGSAEHAQAEGIPRSTTGGALTQPAAQPAQVTSIGPSYLHPTASSHMLFSPDSAQRVAHLHDRSPLRAVGAVPATAAVPLTAAGGSPPGRSVSAPKPRPQSLSSQMQAHSEQLMKAVLGSPPVKSPAAAVVPVTARGQQSELRSPQPSAGHSGSKVGSPTQPAATTAAPTSASKPKATTNPAVTAKGVRSADALSANKAAKLAALQGHVAHHVQPAAAPTGAARYAQPTHSSAAATASHLASNAPKSKPVLSRKASGSNLGLGIASRTLIPTDGADSTPTATPQRSVKVAHKRPPSAPTASSAAATAAPALVAPKRRETEKLTDKAQRPVHSVERGTRTVERKPETSTAPRSKLPVPSKRTGSKSTLAGQHDPTARACVTGDVTGTTGGAGEAAREAHSDSIMQILEGRDSPNRPLPSYNAARRSFSFGSELSCVDGGESEGMVSLGGSIDFSENNTFDTEASHLSARSTTPTPFPHPALPTQRAADHLGADANISARMDASAACLTVPSLSNRAGGSRLATSDGPLRLQQLEDNLANVSMVDAPTSFSPSNLSNLSNFTQDMRDPVQDAPGSGWEHSRGRTQRTGQHNNAQLARASKVGSTDEVSVIHHATSATNLSQQDALQARPRHGRGENAWAEEYTPFFPPEINLIGGNNANLSGDPSAEEDSPSRVNIATTLNYTGVDLNGSAAQLDLETSDHSGLQLRLEQDSLSSVLDMATFAASPLPQNIHASQHHATGAASTASLGASAVASTSDALNQGMLMSRSSSYQQSASFTSFQSSAGMGLSLAHPGRLYRQTSDNSQSCNISAISQADATPFTCSVELPSMSAHQSVSQVSYDRSAYVGASADSLVSNVLDRAMIASYSYEQETSGYEPRISASESTTSVSPYLRAHMTTRSNSGFTPVVRTNPIAPGDIRLRAMFSPPPPPEVETILPMSGDNTLSASQQFDYSVDAVFSEHALSGTIGSANWAVGSSVESLPPPPPPPLEDSDSKADSIKQKLIEKSLYQFSFLRSAPSSPEAPSLPQLACSDTDSNRRASAEYVSPQASPLADMPRIPSFGSVHSESLLCSTDSAEVALSAGLAREMAPKAENSLLSAAAACSVGVLDEVSEAETASDDGRGDDQDGQNGAEGSEFDGSDEDEVDFDLNNDFGDFAAPVDDMVNFAELNEEDGYVENVDADADDSVDGDEDVSDTAHVECEDVVEQEGLSEEEELSDYDAEPSDLHLVNASIQSVNTSRLGSAAGSTNVSCSYTSSMDELHSVNPLFKSDRWVLEHYPRDSLSSSGGGGGAVPAEVNTNGAYLSESDAQGTMGIATPAKLLLLKDGRADYSYVSSNSPVPLPKRSNLIVREECYRSSRTADSSTAAVSGQHAPTCPDPLASQLLVMSPGMAELGRRRKDHRMLQSVFVPLQDTALGEGGASPRKED